MSEMPMESGFAAVNGARLYYELAGEGTPFVMLHAGVADHRQWNNEFAAFAPDYRVLRYDLRGFGQSEPVEGEFSHLQDLTAVLNSLHLDPPFILMGCSMSGALALDYALEHPSQVKALIMVASAPSGLDLDVPVPEKFAEVDQAITEGDMERVAELETQIWFDGGGRTPDQVDPAMRRLAYDMNRIALEHEGKKLGKRLPDTATPARERLSELQAPLLILTGEHDVPYILAASEVMLEKIPSARRALLSDAAHLPNLDQPVEFERLVSGFLKGIG